MAQNDDEKRTTTTEAGPTGTTTTATAAAEQNHAEEAARRTSTLQQIRQQTSEDDDTPTGLLTLRTILGGDILSADLVRRQVWLLLLIVLFVAVSVAFRYQCQQDEIQIAKLEAQLTDIKYKATASTSALTERKRKSRVIEALRQNNDTVLHTSKMPPYIILVGSKE